MKTRRLLGTLAALAVGAALVPVAVAGTASAAASCTAPSNLTPNYPYRSTSPDLKTVTLSWSPVQGAASYDVQAGFDEDFASNIQFTATTVGTQVTIPVGTLNDASFFWRVKVTGAVCWSDDGGAHAASVTKGWDAVPQNIDSCAKGTIPMSKVIFCWTPVQYAAYYEVFIHEAHTGQSVGRCFTQNTYVVPEAMVRTAPDADERLDAKRSRCFGTTALQEGQSYVWSVDALDQSGLTLNGKFYGNRYEGLNGEAPKDSPPVGPVTVTSVDPRFGPSAGNYTVTVEGSGFVAGSTSVMVAGLTIDKDHVNVVSDSELTFQMPSGAKTGSGDLTVNVTGTTGGVTSPVSPYDQLTVFEGKVGDTDDDDYSGSEYTASSDDSLFTISSPAPTGTMADITTIHVSATNSLGNLASDSCKSVDTTTTHDCATTPLISWTADPAAVEYRVSVYQNAKLSNLIRTYETHSASFIPRDLLLPNQAGHSYTVVVQPCNFSYCKLPADEAASSASFRIRTLPVTLISPAQGTATTDTNVNLSWSNYLTSTGSSLDAGQYLVQVATDCDFTNVVATDQVDNESYAAAKLAYAAGTYYWRVAAVDAAGTQYAWGAAPNRDSTDSSPTCGDVQRFTIATPLVAPGTAGTGGGTTTAPAVSAPLTIHYGVPVTGVTAATTQLVEGSTGRVIPTTFTALTDGGSVLPNLKDLVPGDQYSIRVTGPVLDGNGFSVAPLPGSSFRAPTLLQAPGVYVKLGGTWQTRKAAGSYGGTAVVTTSKKRPSASVRFRSSSITVGYCKGPQNGYLAVYVDGKLKKTVSTYAPFTTCGKPGSSKAPAYTVGKLDGTKQHTITVVETGKKGTRKGINAAIDYFTMA